MEHPSLEQRKMAEQRRMAKPKIFISYVANVFCPFIMLKKIPLPVLLFVDGLTSFQSPEVAQFCREKQIFLD